MVGCVILDAQGHVAGEGYHARCGGPHAEVEALRRAGARARGGTAVVTLEPCNHTGRTGPCSVALMQAGVARVVYACTDPAVPAAGGADALRAAGVEVLQVPCQAAARVTAPFLHRVRTGLPWVTAKWAQSADGLLVAPPGQDRWISGLRSRAKVHGERGRVDVVLTGMGTVLADDPLLTARGQRPLRHPMRVVWDPRLELPLASQLVRTAAAGAPVVAACLPGVAAARAVHAAALRAAGVHVVEVADLRALLRWLAAERRASTVLVEAGPRLLRALFGAGLVNDAWVFVSPRTFGGAPSPGLLRELGLLELSRHRSAEDTLLKVVPGTPVPGF